MWLEQYKVIDKSGKVTGYEGQLFCLILKNVESLGLSGVGKASVCQELKQDGW